MSESKLVGSWELISSENFDEYMKEIGVNIMQRKIAATIKPNVIISNVGDNWVLRLESTLRTSETKFTDGVEFLEDTLDGRKCKSIIKSEGPNKLVQEQRDLKTEKVVSTITREVNDKDEYVTILIAGQAKCVRVYNRT